MKLTIKNFFASTALLSAFAVSQLACAAEGPVSAPDLIHKPEGAITAKLDPSYEPGIRLMNPPTDIYLNKDLIIDTSKGGSAKGSSSGLSGAAGPLALLGAPPVYSVALNGSYNDTLTTAVPEKWYVFPVTTATKITSLLQHASTTNSNIDIELYRMPTGASSYSFVAGSYYAGSSNEQLSEITVPGSYLLMIRSVGTITGGSYTFGSFSSTGADTNEPDDNFWQPKTMSATATVTGNLDTGSDQDFRILTLASADNINYKITGGNYQAQLFSSSGSSIITLPNNTFGRLSIPAGTYYWAIKSPTSTAGPSVPYTFNAFRNIDNITFNFNSDEGIAGRVNWGAGNYFAFKTAATITGYAYDTSGAPVAGAPLRFTLTGSVGTSVTTVTATTNASGFYSATISSPTGAGANSFNGACNIYYYDVHSLIIQREFGATLENISSIKLIEGSTQTTVTGSQVLLNDVAYYIFTGC